MIAIVLIAALGLVVIAGIGFVAVAAVTLEDGRE
jgi:hypothetical protein